MEELLGPAVLKLSSKDTYTGLAKLFRLLTLNRKALASPGFLDVEEDMHLPTGECFEKYGLTPLNEIILPLHTGYGYGYARDIPPPCPPPQGAHCGTHFRAPDMSTVSA